MSSVGKKRIKTARLRCSKINLSVYRSNLPLRSIMVQCCTSDAQLILSKVRRGSTLSLTQTVRAARKTKLRQEKLLTRNCTVYVLS